MDVSIVGDGQDIFVVADGLRIAKRGRPGTPQARAWIVLEPGWRVKGDGESKLWIAYDPPEVH